MSSTKSCYEILKISRDATDSEVRKGYRKRALQVHPDKNKDNPNAESEFAEVYEAYALLKDKDKRDKHDKELRALDERKARREKEDKVRRKQRTELELREEEARLKREGREKRHRDSVMKDRVREEMLRFRKEFEAEQRLKAERIFLKRQKEKDDEEQLHRVIKVDFNGRPATEGQLRTIMSHYGKIELVIVKKNHALVGFATEKAAGDAVSDPELESDFDLNASFLRKGGEDQGGPATIWETKKDKKMSFFDYEDMVLKRMEQAAKRVPAQPIQMYCK